MLLQVNYSLVTLRGHSCLFKGPAQGAIISEYSFNHILCNSDCFHEHELSHVHSKTYGAKHHPSYPEQS